MIKKKSMAVSDPFLISRVKQYLEDNVHQTYVDVAVMARALQDRYEDYGKRKPIQFRMMVEQAYKTVLHSYGLDSNPSSDDNDVSDLEFMDTSANTNHMNNMLTNLYSKQINKNNNRQLPPTSQQQQQQQQTPNENELIDILSSDEEEAADERQQKQQQQQQQLQQPQQTQQQQEIQPVLNNKNNNNNAKNTLDSQQNLPNLRSVTISKVNDSNNSGGGGGGARTKSATVASTDSSEKRNVSSFGNPYSVGPLSKKRRFNQENNEKQHQEGKSEQQKSKTKQNSDGISNGAGNDVVPNRPTKRFKKSVTIKYSQHSFRDMGGVDKILRDLCEILFHVKHPEIYHTIGLAPPKGILLHGPPGCGKTLLAYAIAGQLKIGLIEVPATELIAGVSGESEERIREIFEQAKMVSPCVLFIDDIDAISSNRLNAQKDMERRVVSQLISCMDNLSKHESGDNVVVIGATTRPECLDPALRRVGRFDHEIALGVPDRKEREEILINMCDVLSLEMPFNYGHIAELTPGFVGADLLALVTRAASIAVKRKYLEKMQSMQDNIPIVDLVDENQSIMETTATSKENTENNSEITESEKNNLKATENGDTEINVLQNENASEIQNGKIVETETDIESVKTKEIKNNEITSENEKSEEAKTKVDDDVEKMEVDGGNVQATEKSETIDVDELLTDDELSTTAAINTTTTTTKTTTTNNQKTNKECKISLFEMIGLLCSNSVQIQDYEFDDICITEKDFEDALKCVQPSAKREGFITVPDVTWNDIGSLHDIREELQLAILAPVKYPEKMEALGLQAPSGVLLCGPPGCGKTLLAKAIANEAGINFISVKGPELMNMYVGESERAVRTCFQRARNSAPCVIFFDEFDSLCPKRSDSMEGGSGIRVVNQLLTEMDGIEERKGVFLMAATNRPDIIDPAILRPGRLDTILYVGLPEQKDREEILNALTKHRTQPVLDDDVDLSQIAIQTDGFTGADLAGLVRQASMLTLKDSLLNPDIKIEDLKVTNKHFMNAVKLVKPSVSLEDRKVYEKLKMKYAAPRGDKNLNKA